LLFAYTMGLLGYLVGYLGGWSVTRIMNPWWAIVPAGAALLLNLSYAPPDLLPLVFMYLLASFLLLTTVATAGRSERWRIGDVDHGGSQVSRFALTSGAVAILIMLTAWRIPVGQVSQGVAGAWETVAGPWQSLQAN